MSTHNTFIEKTLFRDIIENIPLVSLDFVVRQGEKVLLGKRLNKPAKDYWFTIGGRILKNEQLNHTMKRIAKEELGVQLHSISRFLGVFEHLYDDSIYKGVSTHYINLVYEVAIDDLSNLPQDQHDTYRWFTVEELLESAEVHTYVKDIFIRDTQPKHTEKGTL